jgi:signal transduction histidine kinase
VHISARRATGKDLQPFPNLQADSLYETITVEDNGIGFNTIYAGRLFDVFARLNSYDKYEGTGLGLALCKKIALRHNGFIYADAEEGKGATFTVVLPVEAGGYLFG